MAKQFTLAELQAMDGNVLWQLGLQHNVIPVPGEDKDLYAEKVYLNLPDVPAVPPAPPPAAPVNPKPVLTAVNPDVIAAGSGDTEVTLIGDGFDAAYTMVDVNGNPVAITVVDQNSVRFTLPAAMLATDHDYDVVVYNRWPGGGFSNALHVQVVAPVVVPPPAPPALPVAPAPNPDPTLTSVTPDSVVVGSGDTVITLEGTNFVPTSVVRFDGNDMATTYVNATHVTASVPTAQFAAVGDFEVVVRNPAPGGGDSAALQVHVTAAPAPAPAPGPSLWDRINGSRVVRVVAGVALALIGIAFVLWLVSLTMSNRPTSPVPTRTQVAANTPTPGAVSNTATPGVNATRPAGTLPTTAPRNTAAPRASATPRLTATPGAEATARPTMSPNELKAYAESKWGESLVWPPALYSSHEGEEGYPQICAGLCWDTHKVISASVMLWYGPNAAEEDVTLSDASFGNGNKGPLDLVRDGDVTVVVFAITKEAQLEVCAIGSLDGVPLTQVLGINEGECGDRVTIQPGWHVIENNANSPIAGFGVRYSASGWAGMTESQIVQYTKYWEIEDDTATWTGPDDVEVMMVPSMVQMMQDFGTLRNVVFTTHEEGQILLCNGTVSGSANLSSPDGSCQFFDVREGTFTYHGEPRLSAGVSWKADVTATPQP